jgi:hypothetical protein
MVRKFASLAIVSTLIALALVSYNKGVFSQTVADDDTGTLRGFAREAISEGKTEYYLDQHDDYQQANLDYALANYTVLVAEPIQKRSYTIGDYFIGTWYKLRVSETLSQKPFRQCSACRVPPNAPADMLPLNANEILILRSGGSYLIDGVTLFATDPDYPDFMLNQKYLLFVSLDSSRSVGIIDVGPVGAYAVNASGNLMPIYESDPGENPIADGLVARYGNNLNQLRNALNPPTSCDPDGSRENSCYDTGGDWNPSNCACTNATPSYCIRKPWLCE